MSPEDAISSLGHREPDALRLAELASLAVEVQPALLRRLRRSLAPEPSAVVEAVLWRSEIVSSSTPASLLLREDVLVLLRERMRATQDRLVETYDIIKEAHRGSPAILRCEEELVFLGLLALPQDLKSARRIAERIDELLSQVEQSVMEDEAHRSPLLAWSRRALVSLPERVRERDLAVRLRTLAATDMLVHSGGLRSLGTTSAEFVSLNIRWSPEGVTVRAGPGDGVVLRVPPVPPLLVDLDRWTGRRWSRVGRALVESSGEATVKVPPDVSTIRLRALHGDGVVLNRLRGESPAPPKLTWVCVAGTGLHVDLAASEQQAAQALGVALASAGCGLITGAFHGVDHLVSRAFAEAVRRVEGEDAVQSRLRRVVIQGRTPDFEWGKLTRVQSYSDEYWLLVDTADAVVVMGMAPGTWETALTAVRAGRDVMAFPETGADSVPGAERLQTGKSTPVEVVATLLVEEILRRSRIFSETAAWAGERILMLARQMLAPRPFSNFDEVAAELRSELEHAIQAQGYPPVSALKSRRAPERVVGYAALQVFPRADVLADLLSALSREVDFADSFLETRPLLQGLVALVQVRRTTKGKGVGITPVLKHLHYRLLQLPKVDESGQCKALINEMLSTEINEPLSTQMDLLALQYERLRREQSPGLLDTKKLSELIWIIQAEATRTLLRSDAIIRMYYGAKREGLRFVALACCGARVREAPVEVIGDALHKAWSAPEQWGALLAVQRIVESTDIGYSEPFVAEVVDVLKNLRQPIRWQDNRALTHLAGSVISAFGRKIGMPRQSGIEPVRLWIDAGRKTVPPRSRLAILGSSEQEETAEFARQLATRLVTSGWELNVGRGKNVGLAIIDSFRHRLGRTVRVYSTRVDAGNLSREETNRRREIREQMLSDSHCVILLGGGFGTLTEFELAVRKRLPIIPAPFTGGVAKDKFKQASETLRGTDIPEPLVTLLNRDKGESSRLERIVRVVNVIGIRRAEHPGAE